MRKIIVIVLSMVTMSTMAQGVIDVHSHIITPEFVSALKREGRVLDEGFPLPKWDAEAQLKWMNEAGIQTAVLTLPGRAGDEALYRLAEIEVQPQYLTEYLKLQDLSPLNHETMNLVFKRLQPTSKR